MAILDSAGHGLIKLSSKIKVRRHKLLGDLAEALGTRHMSNNVAAVADQLRDIRYAIRAIDTTPRYAAGEAPGENPLHQGDIAPMVRIVGVSGEEHWISSTSIHLIQKTHGDDGEPVWLACVGDSNVWIKLTEDEAHLLTQVMNQVRDVYRVWPKKEETNPEGEEIAE